MVRLCLDYGHGGEDPGAIYKGRCEKNDVLNIGKAVAKELRRHGVIVDETRTTDKTMSLRERSNFEKSGRYDYFISFHRNAFKPERAQGVETFIYLNQGAKAKELADRIQKGLVDIGFVDRGVKTANFHVLRETKAPAVLIEIGFIDNSKDNQLFDEKRDEIINAISKAILSQLKIKYKKEKDSLEEALDVLVKKGLINSPDYWLINAKEGKQVKGEFAALLIERVAKFLK